MSVDLQVVLLFFQHRNCFIRVYSKQDNLSLKYVMFVMIRNTLIVL